MCPRSRTNQDAWSEFELHRIQRYFHRTTRLRPAAPPRFILVETFLVTRIDSVTDGNSRSFAVWIRALICVIAYILLGEKTKLSETQFENLNRVKTSAIPARKT